MLLKFLRVLFALALLSVVSTARADSVFENENLGKCFADANSFVRHQFGESAVDDPDAGC